MGIFLAYSREEVTRAAEADLAWVLEMQVIEWHAHTLPISHIRRGPNISRSRLRIIHILLSLAATQQHVVAPLTARWRGGPKCGQP